MRTIACFAAAVSLVMAQPARPPGITEQYGRAVQLMEATAAVVPGLARASDPLIENAKQTLSRMRLRNHLRQNSSLHYTFLTNLRAYLTLFDGFPKQAAVSEEGMRQIAELRGIEAVAETGFEAMLKSKEETLRFTDRDNLRRYQEADAKAGLPQAGKPRVVFLGDSITDFWRLNEYYPDSDFLNRGISGQITGQMLGRMAADVIALKPVVMVFLGGTNDLARNVPAKTIEDNIRMICDLAEKNGIKVVLASIMPVHDYYQEKDPSLEQSSIHPRDQILAINSWMQALCRSRGYVYLDYYSALVDGAGFLKKELSDDGLHPNADGYRVMSPLAWEAIYKALPPAAGGKKK